MDILFSNRSMNIIQETSGDKGYWTGVLFSEKDISDIQALIQHQFLSRIYQVSPRLEAKFRANGIENYHLISDQINHSKVWSRTARRFSPEGVQRVQQSKLFDSLNKIFGMAEITAEEIGATPEIQWRLVRPNRPEDTAPIHADYWYWNLNKWKVPKGKKCLKVWTMIGGEAGFAGLNLYPGSHKHQDWPFTAEERHGLVKPFFVAENMKILAELPLTPPGTSIIFDYALLHAGALNTGNTCRVSFEFTIYVPAKET